LSHKVLSRKVESNEGKSLMSAR